MTSAAGASGRAPAFDADRAQDIVDREIAQARAFYGADAESATALLPILHALQEAFGYVPAETRPLIARALNISLAEVRGTISFYHDFRAEPAGRSLVQICGAEACQARGCAAVFDHLAQAHGLAAGATSDDGKLTVETVYCLGNCALGPAALVDGTLVGRLDAARIDSIVAEARR